MLLSYLAVNSWRDVEDMYDEKIQRTAATMVSNIKAASPIPFILLLDPMFLCNMYLAVMNPQIIITQNHLDTSSVF